MRQIAFLSSPSDSMLILLDGEMSGRVWRTEKGLSTLLFVPVSLFELRALALQIEVFMPEFAGPDELKLLPI